ncbi:MAG: type II toxin-antitoxin system HicA family toxin [Proteobacteria bacterium]|nr:type II toxin-antitoxin system HicA family toxin [Pseudomonadota bacterium]MCH8188984.1 type II toxin-antitoxin system HicA family toxin [Pseudomonadota bacterium]
MARRARSSREIIRVLEGHGWVLVRVSGSHHHFRHPETPGLVTVPHPRRTLPKGTIRSIEKQAGLAFQ